MHAMVNNPKMKVTPELTKSRLPDLLHLLEHLSDEQWTLETIKNELLAFVKAKELKNGQVLWPIRCILTGVQASPWAFEDAWCAWERGEFGESKGV